MTRDANFDQVPAAVHSVRALHEVARQAEEVRLPMFINGRVEATNGAISAGSSTHPTVSLVIPAKNEARNLATVLSHVPARVGEVILVDGQSTDVTKLMALSCRPDIRIISESQRGKGHALRAGFAAARGDIIVAMDADGSMAPTEIPNFIYFLEHGFDFVKGSRFIGGGGSLDLTTVRRFGNRALLAVANTLYRTKLTDLCYGYFAFYRKYLDHLDLRSSGFEIETELTIRAVLAGLRIAEIPSMEMPRRSGHSSLRTVPDGARVLRTLLSGRSAAGEHRT
jgi:glycosyltransferase involved in cell wall biosynthesis